VVTDAFELILKRGTERVVQTGAKMEIPPQRLIPIKVSPMGSCAVETPPLVTVGLICYNHARFVVEALDSIRAQAYPSLHLVVVDDCSSDDSAKVIREWLNMHWPTAVFVAHEINTGVCRSVNDVLANAKGKYIRCLAADDRWAPDTLPRQIEVMEQASEDVGVLYGDAFQMDERGELLPKKFIETHRSFAKMPEGQIFNTLAQGNFIPAMSAVIRLRCFEAVGGYDETLVFEDWDMWLRISRQFKFKYFPEPVAYYRLLQTSMSNALREEMFDSSLRIIVNCLRRGWLAGEQKQQALDFEFFQACEAYRRRLPNRTREAAWSFRNRRSIKRFLLLLFVLLGLPYRRFEQLAKIPNSVNQLAELFPEKRD